MNGQRLKLYLADEQKEEDEREEEEVNFITVEEAESC